MSEFKQYRRKQIAELRPTPKNHADRWLVAAQYFADNFEPAP